MSSSELKVLWNLRVAVTSLIVSWFMLFSIPPIGSAQDFYDLDQINTIEIFFDEFNWDEILDSLYAAGEEERLLGTAVINGTTFNSVGVRYKGASSYSPDRDKNPLNIKLDYVIEDQTLDGYGTLKLSNLFKDPSFVREAVSYEIARKYMSASGANFANVYINDELIGLYSNVQSVDGLFLNQHFYSDNLPFFKGELSGAPPDQVQVWGYYGPEAWNYYYFYEMRSDEGWYDLVNFLDVFNNNPEGMEQVLGVDRHLWMLAFDILLVNLDSPVNIARNYYLYEDHSGQFNPIPWDLNESLGVFNKLAGDIFLTIPELQQLDPFLNITNPDYPIINRVLNQPSYQKMYVAHMKTMMDEIFASSWYLDRILEVQAMIDADVRNDPFKFYSYEDFENNVYEAITSETDTITGLTQLMDARVDFLIHHPAFQGTPPTIVSLSHSLDEIPAGFSVTFNAEVQAAELVVLSHRYCAADPFVITEMFDDGFHGDGAAGDGIYGAVIEVQSTSLQYYFYTENDEAGIFSPARAEHECYSLYPGDGLLINEFMAINDLTLADPQGDFDDWIELYNPSDDTVFLAGMYLTDDLAEPDKWAFPDTFALPGDYLLVWADDDADPGLHAGFKLSGDGEVIGLYRYSADSIIPIDVVNFGPQQPDVSWGRYPDGADQWQALIPTPLAENIAPLPPIPEQYRLDPAYPNPFNSTTVIGFYLPQAGWVRLEIYDVAGRRVLSSQAASRGIRWYDAGAHEIRFKGINLSSGVYLYRIEAGEFSQVKKMVLMK